MGNSVRDGGLHAENSGGTITKFYTPKAWIDGQAEQQLAISARLAGVRRFKGPGFEEKTGL
ncbi:hypothetical protein AB838_10520 [Rhodobacteraceae bacterium (ex Bugula neritina AB1)]|nr:hypothetical protein AB838_10520 [Rhodobacteraceae bacterium (ex Bugula neritina AB1)]